MVKKGNIKKTLQELNRLYRNDTTGRYSEYYSKLAHLELCGWIELAQDEIVLWVANKYIKNNKNLRVIKETVKRNSNMGYDNNFKSMLKEVIGLIGFEKLENNVDITHKSILEIELENLKITRNSHAHTNIKNCTLTLDAPSTNLSRMEKIYDALKEYERKIKQMKC